MLSGAATEVIKKFGMHLLLQLLVRSGVVTKVRRNAEVEFGYRGTRTF
jgi:hypothetical protein